ncbi:hypothetical protein [Brevundimonas sp.]|uniref:hypothetical protein n=1 Tax=Brevundimonas sp. TaxID=1871086 RepID=UPI002BC5C2FA|nr:hypothetical protein [Brevundimonas sp.]HWQ85523.1 hypothetical protein [Brevundimonas sp.]
MTRILTLVLLASMAGGCTIPTYEADPVSVYQWERRQEGIQRQHAERERLCRITKEDDPRKEELCRGVSGASQ